MCTPRVRYLHTILAQTRDLSWLRVYHNFMKSTAIQPVKHERAALSSFNEHQGLESMELVLSGPTFHSF